ncbi:MAG: tRNA (N6-threonylcarbamoyladenosine(37)-N6)-methyltransferase TrmO [Chloroflexota bacterium]|jgi:tRNA-Thr(GGU) m(6)t(6)A37 methyltransferase TsaA|nr:tRNA (N6-threonylcarbamoyladenosine(37)-N6)-methyltransferase TrmO [Chloroflexota bacterium]
MAEKTTQFIYIGFIQTPHKDFSNIPTQPHRALGVPGEIVIKPEYQEGLDGLEKFSYIDVLFHLHHAEKYHLKTIPYLGTTPRGIFATRSPRRPNSIGLSTLKLISVEANVISVENVDMMDGTPILDIKPHIPFYRQEN